MRRRILFISNLYPNPYRRGMAEFNRQQVLALSSHYDIAVVSPVPWTTTIAAIAPPPVAPLAAVGTGVEVHHPTYYYLPGMLRKLQGEAFLYSILPTVRRLAGQRPFDLVYASWLFPDAWAASRIAQRLRVPLFVKVHGSDVNRLAPSCPVTSRSLEAARRAQKVLCVSRALQERLATLGIDPAKMETVYNGVDSSLFFPVPSQTARLALGIEGARPLILYVGNLKVEKGIMDLLEAYRNILTTTNIVDTPQLAIIGSGPCEDKVKKFSLPGAKVLFLGTQQLESIALWMNAASVLCLPSYNEGVPNVVLEAQACRTPVVATRVGGIPEIFRDDGSMILVDPGRVDQLTQALLKMIQAASERKAGPVPVGSWQDNAEKLVCLFEQALSHQGGRSC
ncbi:hypothetical protein GMST_00960 [Geomonas silvestris]|uniref:Glycosyltransferase subfamily 4-like N-terminal domain-containing protein n=1 Tax=Geomonas silvestris TaxID=2740184 RepID=A0A6V8MCQ1_9BACT|nr:glycosyltransferase [Geomonas silvestris]GFO57771.1 hypothetical protein GMST_00960 [Geomonas silvestris]